MNKSKLIGIIALTLTLFLIARGVASLVCEPTPNNPVVAAVSSVVSAPEPVVSSTKPDPFSWEPVLRSIASFVSKTCPK